MTIDWLAGCRYVYIVYHRDSHLRVYASNQPKETLEKANRIENLLKEAREMEQFYKPGKPTTKWSTGLLVQFCKPGRTMTTAAHTQRWL